ncbi:MAG: choice-of-anchor J domain-containing protein [Bacteroidaceae bacterium]|nr:choice-of-anchor J domain-containing protein [Bacteroidaceae bacterium]
MKIKNLFLAAMTLFAFSACTFIPESPYDFPLDDSTEGGAANGGTTEEGVYINETFASSFGVFSTVETVGNTPWIIDYKTAKATSYVDGVNKEATSWLISTPVDFTNETEAYVAFEYIIRYSESGKVAKNHQLLISSDYAGDPAKATWTDLPYGAVEGSDWTTFYKANVAVPTDFLKKSGIVFALRYTATTKAGTWEVRNFKVAHGTAAEPEKPEDAQEYTVAEAMAAFTGTAKPAIVKGYIVGTVNGQVYAEGCVFSGTAESNTNLLIADNADETDYNNCMPVQLPSGAVRSALNLVDNPGNYKKQVTLTGSLEKYFGVTGLKSVSKYVIDGVTPEEPETPEGAYISESFATSFGTFTTQETVGNYPWVIDFSTAKATSYVDGVNNAAESWLVSPTIDLTNETEAYIAFEYIIRYAESGKVADNHQLLICNDFSGDVATASWVNIPYGAVEGADWQTFYKANVAVPAEFLGNSTVTFALRYMATSKAGTWEVKNFVVAHGAATGETPEEPETPDTPVVPSGENLLANGSFEDWSGSSPIAWGEGNVGHNATIAQSNEARTGSYSVIVNGTTTNKRLASKSYTLAAGTYTFSVYVKANGADAGHCRIGYVPLTNGVAGQYKYETPAASAAPAEWTPRVYEFTLTEQTEVAFVVMNNKTGNGASFLVDDASLTTTDGSISDGGNEEGGNEEGGDEEEPETPAAGGEYLNETFATDLGSFKTQEVVGNFPWVFAANYGAKASGYSNGASQDAESWLISPAMNLAGETAANIAFDYVINKGDVNAAAANHKLLVTNNYTGDVTTTEWVEVDFGAVNNNNWTFHNTGEIALPGSVMGKSAVVVAFKYMSTTANSSTWEIKNVVVSSATK